ncbi:23S rRNA pseudouridine955/2504/2580 synthase [Alkalispirochaeta americana]|uniref:23S rRNA pseudouridine955/2504/2580 synthase n=1 Tax=Alkalispirochaeta americana TaxID=159291 RepID=A0A1N6NAH7_9SPIO|nr:RluA family pseudouridine synthase [Alkalispirochaeta americana]SIP89073.1 23S rRNA pseudouridine955/2504/2580 synthase [Alkalispirochaeta americana]
MISLAVKNDDHQRRLDRVLRKAFPQIPPGALARAVRRGAVRVNGRRCHHNSRLQEGDIITAPSWESSQEEPSPSGSPEKTRETAHEPRLQNDQIIAGSWTIPILERTPHWIALSKPQGLSSQGPASLEGILRDIARARGWWKESLSFRPGPVHRLDRNTTGVQLFALSTRGAQDLSQAFQTEGGTVKLYLAVLQGRLTDPLSVDLPLCYLNEKRKAYPRGSLQDFSPKEPPRYAPARTEIIPLVGDRKSTLAAVIPHTGRTHQIRCHCAAAGYPLEGDRKYQPRKPAGTASRPVGRFGSHYLLHARALIIPGLSASWTAPLPPEGARNLAAAFGNLAEILVRADGLAAKACPPSSRSATINP